MINHIFQDYINNYRKENIFIEPFFEDKIIVEKSNNIIIQEGKNFIMKKRKVFTLTETFDGCLNYYFSVYKMNTFYVLFYRAWDKLNKSHNSCNFAYSISDTGLDFTKKGILLQNKLHAHNFYPYFYNNKIIGLGGTSLYTKGLDVFELRNNSFSITKNNIINKKIMLSTEWHPQGNHFDSLNTINYHENKFYLHVRHNSLKNPSRQTQLFITKDLIQLSKPKICCYKDNKVIKKPYYYGGVVEYTHTNYNLSIPTYFINSLHKYCDSLFFTKKNDQLNFTKINKLSLNKNCSFVNGMVPNFKNNKYLIYVVNNYGNTNLHVDCFSIEKDRFRCISCIGVGYCKIKISNRFNITDFINNFFINFESFQNGYINIQIINSNNKVYYKSDNIKGNHIEYKIKFRNVKKIDSFDNLYLLFNINDCCIYSYKIKSGHFVTAP